MNHEEAQEHLEEYVDERLDRQVRRQLEEHLSGCSECRSILDGVSPVNLEALPTADVNERTLRRSVRRALWRTVFDAAGMLIFLIVGLWVLSTLVLHPLLMNRGGRSAAAARATYDVASMFNEGAFVEDFTIDSGVFDRAFTAAVQMPVGAGMADLGVVSSRIGLFRFGGEAISPFVDSDSRIAGVAQDVLGRLGDTAVATVSVRFYEPISVDQAQLLADSSVADVSVVWAGFLLSEADPTVAADDPLRTLGYSTCVGLDRLEPRLFGASSASAGGDFGSTSPSVPNALAEVRRALSHLADNPDVTARLLGRGVEGSVNRAVTYLADTDPRVESLVVTGPADEVLKFFDRADSKDGLVLAVDFYNWSGPVCVPTEPSGSGSSAPQTSPSVPVETSPPTEVAPLSGEEAIRVLGGELGELSPELIVEAGRVTGGFRTGFMLPVWFEEGARDVREAVAQVLGQPNPWNAQILVGMSMGRPRPSFRQLEGWEGARQSEIEALRDAVLDEVYGERADLALSLLRRHILTNLSVDRPAWYDVPSVITAFNGAFAPGSFVGELEITSETGERSDVPVEAVRTDWGWDVVGAEWPVALVSGATAVCDQVPSDTLVVSAGERPAPVLFGCSEMPERVSPTIQVFRAMPAAMHPVEGSLRGLLAGPTTEEAASGLRSAFSDATVDALVSVSVSDGVVVVDFTDAIRVGNANTSTGSIYFVGELEANIFQDPTVSSVEFRINGSCEDWSGFFQSDGCPVTSRTQWQSNTARWDRIFWDLWLLTPRPEWFSTDTLGPGEPPLESGGGANGSGCTPGREMLPDGLWFGFATERTPGGVIFDLACFWSGPWANWMALGFGETDVPVSNDYLITNQTPRLRTIPVAAETPVRPVEVDRDEPADIRFRHWPLPEAENPLGCDLEGDNPRCLVWLYLNGGEVTEIVEQYVP